MFLLVSIHQVFLQIFSSPFLLLHGQNIFFLQICSSFSFYSVGQIFSFSKYFTPFASPFFKYFPSPILFSWLWRGKNSTLYRWEKVMAADLDPCHGLPSIAIVGQAISPSAQSARWLPRALARTARWRPPTRRRRARASPTGLRLPQDLNRVRSGRSSTSTFSLDLFTISSAGSCEVETRPKREAGDVKKMCLENISWYSVENWCIITYWWFLRWMGQNPEGKNNLCFSLAPPGKWIQWNDSLLFSIKTIKTVFGRVSKCLYFLFTFFIDKLMVNFKLRSSKKNLYAKP